MEERKKDYYQALMSAQQFRHSEQEIIGRWMLFFLESLQSLIRKLEVKIAGFNETAPYLNDRQRQIKDFITGRELAKMTDIFAALPQFSTNTLKKT